MLRIRHNAGFFSCCSIRLHEIIEFFNKHKKIPETVDSSDEYSWYKQENRDITFDYFKRYDNEPIDYIDNITYYHTHQFSDYSKIDYANICPFVKKYFTPSDEIKTIILEIESKYKIDYDNICVLFYRGNDKVTETSLCNYNDIINRAKKILLENSNIKFLIQSDETQFINTMLKEFPNNSFYFKDEIRHMPKQLSSVDKVFKRTNFIFSKKYLAITIIMSKCKFIIFPSGNCSLWIVLYRGNADNIQQFLNDKWL